MAKITWTNRENSGVNSAVSASIFNDTKTSVNTLYDIVEAQLGTTSSSPTANLIISGTVNVSGSIIPNTGGALSSSFDLGSSTAAWRDLYVSTGSIKFVGPGGSISSMSKQDIDNIKVGKPIPSTPKALDRDGATITVSTFNETDAIVSQDDTSDATYILFDRDGASRDRITFAAGNDVLAVISEATSTHAPNNTSGTVTLGKANSTISLNASDTVVPSSRTFAISGSGRVAGGRAMSPEFADRGLRYTGTMIATSSTGIGFGQQGDADDLKFPAITTTSLNQGFSRVRFNTPPQNFTSPGPGRAVYSDGDYIEILQGAPYTDGFTATCSFQIPFSMSKANGQIVDVNLTQLYSTSSTTQQGTFGGNNNNTIRRFYFQSSSFPNGIVTGSLKGEWHISSAESGSSYAVTESNVGEGNNGPTLQYFNQPIQILETNNPLQLRVLQRAFAPNTEFDYEENAVLRHSPQAYGSAPGGWPQNLIRNSNPWSNSAPLRVPDINSTTVDAGAYNYRIGFGTSLDLNSNAHFNRVDNNEYFKINNTISDTLFNQHFGTVDRSNFGLGNNMVFSKHTESAYDPSTDANASNTLLPGIIPSTQFSDPYVDLWKSGSAGKTLSEWETFWNANRRGTGAGTTATTVQFGDSSSDGRFFHREYVVPLNYSEEDINNNVSAQTINAPAGDVNLNACYVAPYDGKFKAFANISAISIALMPVNQFVEGSSTYGLPSNANGDGPYISIDDYLEDTYTFHLLRQKTDGTIVPVRDATGASIATGNIVSHSITVKRNEYEVIDTHGGFGGNNNLENSSGDYGSLYGAYSIALEAPGVNSTGSSVQDFPYYDLHLPGMTAKNGSQKLGFKRIQKFGPWFGSATGITGGDRIRLEAGDKLFMTVEIKTKELYGLDYGGNPKDASLTSKIERFDAYAAGRYFGFEGNDTVIRIEDVDAEITNETGIFIPEGNYGGLADDYPTAFFRIENENFPRVMPVSCTDDNVAFGVTTGGIVVASGSFLSVGNLVSGSEGFDGELGNFISCSAENVLAVGQQNVLHTKNQAAIGKNNDVFARESVAVGSNNDLLGGGDNFAAGDNNTIVNSKSGVALGHSNIVSCSATSSGTGANVAIGYNNKSLAWGSIAMGGNNLANEDYAHAEGYYTTASGMGSHSEGKFTLAGAVGSHAEGSTTVASGDSAHAEGISTIASGRASHAEGQRSEASGDFAHASGFETTASGDFSYTEGYMTKASGLAAHAEGGHTHATADASHAEGSYVSASGTAAHAEGGYTRATSHYAHAEGSQTLADSTAAHAEGFKTTASAVASHAEGYNTHTTRNAGAGHAEGTFTIADDTAAHAEGTYTLASGLASHAEGSGSKATGEFAHAEGNETVASGGSSHAEGLLTSASGEVSHAEGFKTTASATYAHAEGQYSVAVGLASHAEGDSTYSSNTGSHAEGSQTLASGLAAHAEGRLTTASGNYSHAEGFTTKATSTYTHAEGAHTTSNGISSHAEGSGSIASGNASHAEGLTTAATGLASHAEGRQTSASGDYSHAEGYSTIASAENSHAEGNDTNATGENSHAEGLTTFATANSSHAEGRQTLASGLAGHAEGRLTTASGNYSHAEGLSSIATGLYAHAEGSGSTATGIAAHAEGFETKALGSVSHAEGYQTSASGQFSHAEGGNTKADASFSHAEGSATLASGAKSHAEGTSTLASGDSAHAEGYQSTASGNFSHAEGNATVASGITSHTEGQNTLASGDYAHAEGSSSIASGVVSHAEGASTIASGFAAHSQGRQTLASGNYSFAGGHLATASGAYSVALGYNTQATALYSLVGGSGSNDTSIAQASFTWGENNINGGLGSALFGENNTISNYSNYNFVAGASNSAGGSKSAVFGIGNTSQGSGDFVAGSGNTAESSTSATIFGRFNTGSGNYTLTAGQGNVNDRDHQLVAGKYNATGSATMKGAGADGLLVLGNGTNAVTRSNAVEVYADEIFINTGSLPTSDPTNVGQLWRDGTTLKISLG